MLQVEPADELVLEGPFNRPVCKKLKVYNPSKHTRVAFKLKTTTPRLFFVRPNVGLVKPGGKVEIDIFVHPIHHESNSQRHKFLMQAAEANETVEDLQEFWKTMNPALIWDTKIKVKLIDVKVEPETVPPPEGEQQSVCPGDNQSQSLSQTQSCGNPEAQDSVITLKQQLNMLELERDSLVQKVEALSKEYEQQKLVNTKYRRSVYRFAIPFFMLVALVSAFLGYKYV
ncbi:hypothetical protein KR222_002657 [Zaprionus bogoriensis]|nr:hypothetical protein KR222_002657 [Zaprionus bogoriensis]